MKFMLTENELAILNHYLKSSTIQDTLQQSNIKCIESERQNAIHSLMNQSLLQQKGDSYALADIIQPFSKSLDDSDIRLLTVSQTEDGDAFESKGICALKKRTIGVLNKDGDCFALEFYERNALKDVFADFLDLDIAEFSDNDPLPPFTITVSMKHLDDFINAYKDDHVGAAIRYQKIFGIPAEHVEILASTVIENHCRSQFIVQTKQNVILYTIYRQNGITIIGCVKKKLFSENAIFSHHRIDEIVKWIGL